MSRLSKAEILNKSFLIDKTFSFDAHFEKTFGIFQGQISNKIVVRVYGETIKEFKKMKIHKTAKVKYPDKTTMELTLDVIGFEDVENFFLRYPDSTEIISPPKLRAKMKNTLKRALELYN